MAIGIASVTHQTAIKTATARVAVISGLSGFKSVKIKIDKEATSPNINPSFFVRSNFEVLESISLRLSIKG